MKATDVIARDHRAAEELFDAYKSAGDEERRDLEKKLFKALTVHEMMEDTHFYPVLKEVGADEPAVQQILDEQTKLKMKVMEKGALEVVTGEHEDRITAMMEDVLAHAKEEEDVIFPLAEQLLGAAKLEELGEKMEPDSAVAKSE
ncbi:MAG: hemerythrin domain-containing protein [Bacillota bacterium]